MIIRNSLTSILRTKKKTTLFFMLILLLSVFLGMGVSIWVAGQDMMKECGKNYQTIGIISYMGSGYPDESYIAVETLRALESITEEKLEDCRGVLAYEPSRKCLGYIADYERKTGDSFYQDQCILVIKNCYWASVFQSDYATTRNYVAEVEQQVYTHKWKNIPLVYPFTEERSFSPEYDKQYLVYGVWVSDGLMITHYEEIENTDLLQKEEHEAIKKAEFYQVVNNAIKVQMTADPEQLTVFHQGNTELLEGSFYRYDPKKMNISSAKKVCLVTDDIALGMNLQVGDMLPVTLIPVNQEFIYDSYVPGESYVQDSYEITGIIKSTSEFNNQVYISSAPEITGTYGYEVGQVLLENGSGDLFMEDMEPFLLDRMIIDIYDQGYTQIMDPLNSLQQTTLIFLCIFIAVTLAVLVLFGYLFVYKQQDTVIIMKHLGTEKPKIYIYLMISSGAIAVTASFMGAIVGYGISHYVLKQVMSFLESGIGIGIDTRFSYLKEEMIKEYTQINQVPIAYFLITAAAITVSTVLICLILAIGSLRLPKNKKKKQHLPKEERNSSALSGVVLRYSLLSIVRGGMRTFTVCLVSGALMLVFCMLTFAGDSYRGQRQRVDEDLKVEGYFTDLTGKRISKLGISAEVAQELVDSGYVEDVGYTLSRSWYHYFFLGIPKYADGRTQEVAPKGVSDPIEQPYSYEKLLEEEARRPCLLYTNDFLAVGEFFYSTHPNIVYMEGYNKEDFFENADREDIVPCLISEKTMEEQNVHLGDTIRVGIIMGSIPKDYQVVGYYSGEGNTEHILIPANISKFTEETFLDTLRFTLKDASQLFSFKDFLESKGYSQVQQRNNNNNGSFIVLKDTQYQKTIQQLDEKIKYMNLLYPLLFVLAGFISFLVSYLMMHNRKRELALMQSMGTPRWKAFYAFFLEQASLSLTGILLVFLIWGLITGFSLMQAFCIIVCFFCYLAGCGLAVGILNRIKVLELLRDKE